ncbi:chalcone-flavanone isomerase-domain-containing protein [Radiomyces spectabilis]|uniref:chalcone-flavanone isomerase-domain-containing protein n=1 Tax=Radiomyces spectabilis TaxID=64574 RepID=UPI00221F22FA|nr:chalcone-flavanone isomerase-domain-containing protein [Radiomyces spectabilis]KAI8393685.1 chalcone-flavanone isomerase-domain-containing protein [Radiomyces spectabilis]
MNRFTRPLARLTFVSPAVISSRSFATASATVAKHRWPSAARVGAWAVLGLGFGSAYYAWQTQHSVVLSEAATAYAGTVEDPETKLAFPINLQTGSEWKRLIGLGARQVSFMNLNVYVLGLYMRGEDIGALRQVEGWKDFDKREFLGDEKLALALLHQPMDVSIRIVPVRATNTQHLRDGFTRALLQRMREQNADWTEDQEMDVIKGIQEFKTIFINAKVKSNTEFVFTKTREGGLKMEFEGKDLGTVNNKWVAINFFMGYLNPKAPASELARQDIAKGFEKLMVSENEDKEKK